VLRVLPSFFLVALVIARLVPGHRKRERCKKSYGKNEGKGISRCSGGIPNWLPNPNERDRSRHDCQRKTNNHNCAENNDYILARYKFGVHKLALSGILIVDRLIVAEMILYRRYYVVASAYPTYSINASARC
jgi:hypothetical protein